MQLLDKLARNTGIPIPLAWEAEFPKIAAIEVYPAGTLRASRVQSTGYKRPEQRGARERVLNWLSGELELPRNYHLALDDPDALDAMICVLAGGDFLSGKTYAPEDLGLAKKEGWIWIRK